MKSVSEHEFSYDELALAAASSSYKLEFRESFEKKNQYDRLALESSDHTKYRTYFAITIILFTLVFSCFMSVCIFIRKRRFRRKRRPIYNNYTHPESVYQSTVEPGSTLPAAEQDETGFTIIPLEEEIISYEKEIIKSNITLNSKRSQEFKRPQTVKRRTLKKSVKKQEINNRERENIRGKCSV
jgi:hypothetical protein